MKEIRVPIGENGRWVENVMVDVSQTFTMNIAGSDELFCIHPAHNNTDCMVVAHCATGGKVYEFHETMPVEEGKKKAIARIENEIKNHGDWYLIMKMAAMPILNRVNGDDD